MGQVQAPCTCCSSEDTGKEVDKVMVLGTDPVLGYEAESAAVTAPAAAAETEAAPVVERAVVKEEPAADSKGDKEAPKPRLLVTFLTPEDAKVDVSFWRRPIGLTFAKDKAPLSVHSLSAGGDAEQLGVKTGFIFHAIDGKEVSGESLEFTTKLLEDRAILLPVVS
mmetsp:Transcript_35382/g.62766  ORF Transcript_35382/g.62766 Transcript_35382/m.62766 type:complete len:166 (+) Transcript_35382:81-578(+)